MVSERFLNGLLCVCTLGVERDENVAQVSGAIMGETSSTRVIIHLDLDCFYAQVEQRRLNIPDGQPVAVQQWGSLLAVNYDARKFGVERGDFVDAAKKKCPPIHLPHVDTLGENRTPGQLYDRTHQKAILRRYRVASREIFAILGSIVPVVEKASIDEAFMDVTDMAKARLAQMTVYSSAFCQDPVNHDTTVFRKKEGDANEDDAARAFPLTDCERLLCMGAVISREIRQAVHRKLGYTCSTGIAGNKLLAKLASPLNKPNGQVVVAPRFVADLMKSLPMRKIRGLGGKLGKQLESIYESLDPEATSVLDHEQKPADQEREKLTAYALLQRCGLAELRQHVGQDTAAYVHQICQGDDGSEPVEEKKVQVKMLSCVKQFDQRSGSALVRLEQLEYWVRLLCEEMVMRCEDERLENKRFPSQLTLQCTKVEEKPRTRKLGIAQDTTVDELFAAAMNVVRLHLDRMFPLAALSMHAKNFVDLDSQAVTSISIFFTRHSDDTSSAVSTVAQRVKDEVTAFAATRGRKSDSSMRQSKRQKISGFFAPVSDRSSAENRVDHATFLSEPTSTCAPAQPPASSLSSSSRTHYCELCKRFVPEPRNEHADFHLALTLSKTPSSEVVASAGRDRRSQKKGPLDAFLER
uniref:DNA polymerase eta n=1 Tax=Peronospora matthiolae TaxID=2874970 RepID=A0AAV1V9X6_9STRA